jgi:DNA-binding transcriptional LysR family regulator
MLQSKIRRYLRHGTLPQLRVFEACVRLGSGTRAAEELHMAQPTASVLLKKLSETVGMPLFEQAGKRVRLTEAGARVHACSAEVFRALAELEESIEDLRGATSGRLRLAAPPAAGRFASRLLHAFAERNPRVDASLEVHEHRVLFRRMRGHDDDLYMLAEPADGRDLVAQAIVANPLVVLAGGDHPLAAEKAIPFPRLAREPLVLHAPGSGTRMAILRLFARHGIAPNIRAEFASDEAIREAVLAGLGVSILPRYVPGLDPSLARLVCLDVEGFPVESHWHVAYPVGRRVCATARAFMDFARAEAKAVFRECLRGPCA